MPINKLTSGITGSFQKPDLEKILTPNTATPSKLGVAQTKDSFENMNPEKNNAIKNELAKVDVEIKEIINEIATTQQKETNEIEEVKNREEQQNEVSKNLDQAADSLEQMLDATKLDP